MQAMLNLDDYFLNEILVKTNKDYIEGDNLKWTIDVEFNIRQAKESNLHFMISLIVKVNEDKVSFIKSSYKVLLKIDGLFSFSEGTDEDTIKKMIAPNGLSILYGVARGVVAQVTANGRFGKLVLPSLNINKVIKRKVDELLKEKNVPKKKQSMV